MKTCYTGYIKPEKSVTLSKKFIVPWELTSLRTITKYNIKTEMTKNYTNGKPGAGKLIRTINVSQNVQSEKMSKGQTVQSY